MSTLFGELRSHIKIDYSLEPKTAFVIRAGGDSPDPTAPDNPFVRINTPYGYSIYVPGSSMKGVFRSHIESILKALSKEVCGFSHQRGADCGKKEINRGTLERENDGLLRYRNSCYSCKMFGSTAVGSIVRFDDLFPYKPENTREEKMKAVTDIEKYLNIRHEIKIDRKSGSVANRALYDIECLSGGQFFGSIFLKNPEKWQLALLLKTFAHINHGYQKAGGQKSRGFGHVHLTIEKISCLSKLRDKIVFSSFDSARGFIDDPMSVFHSSDTFPPYSFEFSGEALEKFEADVNSTLSRAW